MNKDNTFNVSKNIKNDKITEKKKNIKNDNNFKLNKKNDSIKSKFKENDKTKIEKKNNEIKQKNQSKNSEIFEKPETNLKKEINNLKKEILNIQLRTQANIENLKKDTKEKIKIIKKQKKEEIIINLIPIIDNFEKIEHKLQKNKTKRNEKIVEGISLTLFNLKNNLKKIGLKSIKLQDKIFNPNFHETKKKLKPNKNNKYKIESIIKKGYIYNNKILRKLIVSISNSKNNKKKNIN